jgi:thiamine-monophosphate kinase
LCQLDANLAPRSTNLFMILVQELGEQALLEMLQRFCPAQIIGDDAALLSLSPDQQIVVTTDMLVEGVHFSDRTTSPEDVGWRGAAANLSDLAAMGASPLGLTVALGIPGQLSVEWLERLYQGFTACLREYQTILVGGDLCRSPVVSLGITAIGQVKPFQVILRSTAQPGDAILVTGDHGASRAGLELLLHPDCSTPLSLPDRLALIQSHQRPRPRLDVISILRQHYPQGRVSGMDSSDGLADAILQICRASGVGARLAPEQIPYPLCLKTFLSAEDCLDWSLYGGEDFELVLCLEREFAEALVPLLGGKTAIVGEIIAGREVYYQQDSLKMFLSQQRTFQHFSTPEP